MKLSLNHKDVTIHDLFNAMILSLNEDETKYKIKTNFYEFCKHCFESRNPGIKFEISEHDKQLIEYIAEATYKDTTPDILSDKMHPLHKFMITMRNKFEKYLSENFTPIIFDLYNNVQANDYCLYNYNYKHPSEDELINLTRFYKKDEFVHKIKKCVAFSKFGRDIFIDHPDVMHDELYGHRGPSAFCKKELVKYGSTGLVDKHCHQDEEYEISMRDLKRKFLYKENITDIPKEIKENFLKTRVLSANEKCSIHAIPNDLYQGANIADIMESTNIENSSNTTECEIPEESEQILKNKAYLAFNPSESSLKSEILNIYMPAWILGHNPNAKIMTITANRELARDLSNASRMIMKQGWYKELFPICEFSKEADSAIFYKTTHGGFRKAIGVSQDWSGYNVDYLIIDEPQNIIKSLHENYCNDLYMRIKILLHLGIKRTGSENIIMCMKRLPGNADIIGRILENEDKAKWAQLDYDEKKENSEEEVTENQNLESQLPHSYEEKSITIKAFEEADILIKTLKAKKEREKQEIREWKELERQNAREIREIEKKRRKEAEKLKNIDGAINTQVIDVVHAVAT